MDRRQEQKKKKQDSDPAWFCMSTAFGLSLKWFHALSFQLSQISLHRSTLICFFFYIFSCFSNSRIPAVELFTSYFLLGSEFIYSIPSGIHKNEIIQKQRNVYIISHLYLKYIYIHQNLKEKNKFVRGSSSTSGMIFLVKMALPKVKISGLSGRTLISDWAAFAPFGRVFPVIHLTYNIVLHRLF